MNYIKIHDFIIERAKNRIWERGLNEHHIVPRCIGGGDEKENLVCLTFKEHYIIHIILAKLNPNIVYLRRAAYMMSQGKKRKRFEHPRLGAKHTEETKEKIRQKHKGKKFSEERKSRMKRSTSEESNRKRSLALKGKKKPDGFQVGRKHTKESNEKRRIAMLNFYARQKELKCSV